MYSIKKKNSQLSTRMTLNDQIVSEPINIVNRFTDFFKTGYLSDIVNKTESVTLIP